MVSCSRNGKQSCKLHLCVKKDDQTVLAGVSSYMKACKAGYEKKDAPGSGKCDGGTKNGKYCTKDGDCPAGFCHSVGSCTLARGLTSGKWSVTVSNKDPLPSSTVCAKHNHPACYCGKATVSALLKETEASVVWDVLPLGCKKSKTGGCSKRTTPGMYIIAQKERNTKKLECLYFPDGQARTYSNPQRTPRRVTSLMEQLDGMKGKSFFKGTDNMPPSNWCGIQPKPGQSVDEALLSNKAAVFKLTRLDQ